MARVAGISPLEPSAMLLDIEMAGYLGGTAHYDALKLWTVFDADLQR